ncbi:MAG: UDP-N-acetylglucosamine diphosphorylase [Nanoarchaeota archaeon]
MTLEKIVEQLKPEHYFNLSTFRYKDLFNEVEVVWDVLKKLPLYLKEKAHRDLSRATVHPTAIIEGDVYLGKGTIVEPYAVIKGPTIIGENCLIQPFAHIRGNVIMGDYTRIGNYTEVVNAILLGGTGSSKKELAHFAHYNYIGYCVIGSRVVLGARVTTSSLRADWKPVTVKIGENKYDTGLPQFSAVIGDEVQVGCHTLLDPGSLIGKNSWVNGAPFEWKGYLPPKKFAKGKNNVYEIVDKKPVD